MPDPVLLQKGALRRRVRDSRAAMTAEARSAADHELTDRLARLTTELGASRVACYLSTPAEPSTRGFIAWAQTSGVTVLIPISLANGELDWVPLTPGWTERPGRYGIGEPTGPRLGAEALATVDLLMVPAASVDWAGTRLGWGKGYYDRALAAAPRAIPVFAIVFDRELTDSLPSEAHDRPVTGVVTPTAALRLPCAPPRVRS